jgi:diaminohydroxyphosphoribosylaminopyrimidine deaminase/5-amino-6-(5-phosphoribosylamino)uracil reductase
MAQHEYYLRRCIELARLGAGKVSPNPMVGCVIVYDDKIIAEGYHRAFGEAHAEVNAIKEVFENYANAKEILKKSTVYVNLEPCSHFGKTPPCADLIITNEIPKVVIGCRDPFPAINGKGIEKLKNAGIEVIENILYDEAYILNIRFFTRISKQRPYIILKWAETSNGYFAPINGSQKWISSKESKQLVHRWRSEEDAILVGKNTVLADNPILNVREYMGRDPIRIIIDRKLELTSDFNIFDQSQETIIFNEFKTEINGKIKHLEIENFEYLPQLIAYQLYLMDVQSLIVEGGKKTLDLFIQAGLWDEARVFVSPNNWEEGILAPSLTKTIIETHNIGKDTLKIFKNTN